MLSGLETISLKLSDACYENSTFRLDSEYFKKEYLSLVKSIIPISQKMKNFLLCGHYGILPKSEDYTNEGLPLLRGKDLRTGLLNVNDLVKVPHFYFDEKHSVQKDDIFILAKGATIGESDGVLLIHKDMGDIIFNGSCFKVRLNDKINRYFMFIFMMTKYFTFQKSRAVANNGIEYNSIETIRDYMIPQLSFEFQYAIESMARKIIGYSEKSEHLYQQAEKILLTEIGLGGYKSEDKTIAIKTFKESFDYSNRLDAEYYQPKYDEIVNTVKAYSGGWGILGKLIDLEDGNFQPEDKKQYLYIELANIANNGEIMGCINDEGQNLPMRARRKVKTGDIIVSSIEGSLSSIAVIEEEYDRALCSTGFYVMNSEYFNEKSLFVLLKSIIGQSQLKKGCSGTILTAINREELDKIILPKITSPMQSQIQHKVNESFNLRKQARYLLQVAKQAVEIAIENGENKAMEFIEKNFHDGPRNR